jgi:hypothetical protein
VATLGDMSAILSLYTLDQKHLPSLEGDAGTVLEHGREVGQEYDWSGYCMLYTLMYLDERGVDLGEFGEYTMLTSADRRVIDQIDPAGHDEAELDAYLMQELGDDSDDDRAGWAGQAGLDSLKLLHDELNRLGDGEVLLIRIA